MKNKPNNKQNKENEELVKRLDALIRLIYETNVDKEKKLDKTSFVNILNSVGLTPLEIAKIIGKKSATDVSPYLYKKK